MILEFDGIQYGFKERSLLSGIYVKCETGKITGLLGRNGSGKSTLLKIVFGSIPIDFLSVRIDGNNITPPAFTSRRISYLAQHGFTQPGLALRKIFSLYGSEPGIVIDAFPEFENEMDKTIGHLSGGYSRLFEVLLILTAKAPFCLLDEPFSGLAPAMVERLQKFILTILPTKGVLITDHLYRVVMSFSDSLYILSDGRTFPVLSEDDLIRRGYLVDHS